MIDHVTLRVRDLAAAKAFYSAALAPLGYQVGKEYPGAIGLGIGGTLDFWLAPDPDARPQHLAFTAPDRAAAAAFHAAALAAGGTDNGPPGLRLDYHPHYFAAFAFDPSGHNVEVVCHRPPRAARPKKKAKAKQPAARRIAKGPKGVARKTIAKGPKGLAGKLKKKRMAKGPKG
jgi:catechol 2,3-dioxygenase-like lactoylglutathione lyase family enzyme